MYCAPIPFSSLSSTIFSSISIIEHIAFNISSELSRRFLTGPIYAELKFKKDSETTGGNPTYKTIGCLKIGEVKQSLTKDVTQF